MIRKPYAIGVRLGIGLCLRSVVGYVQTSTLLVTPITYRIASMTITRKIKTLGIQADALSLLVPIEDAPTIRVVTHKRCTSE